MKRLQLLRWSGTVLSPRTRPNRSPIALGARAPHRCVATATAFAQAEDFHAPASGLNQYQHLPSPPPQAAKQSARLNALHARLSLSSRVPLETLGRCLIDPSADPHPSYNNSSLSMLGHDILGYHATELILCRYPRVPTAVIFAAMSAYVGPAALADLTKQWGVDMAAAPGGEVDPGLLQFARVKPGNAEEVEGSGVLVKEKQQKFERRWRKGISSLMNSDNYFGELSKTEALQSSNPLELSGKNAAGHAVGEGSTHEEACVNFVRAVFGAVYIHAGRQAAKNFFNAHIASRKLDISKLFVFRSPTRDLSRLCAREGFEAPVARLLSETGRHSIAPVFVVGVFSGNEKLGEGTGASLDEARIRAAVNALKGWYLYSPVEVRVPSDVEGGGKAWKPVLVDGGEVVL